MATEQSKQVIHRLVEEFWNQGHAEVLDELFAPTFMNHDASAAPVGPDREGLKQLNQAFRAAFTDIHTTVDDMVVEGDKIAWRWTFRGTHQGAWQGIPPTGNQVAVPGIVIDRVVNGTIVERWAQTDVLGLLHQLGAVPVPA